MTHKNDNSGISVHDKALLKSVFSRYPNVERVILYGSRALGTFHNNSDVDLCCFGTGISLSQLYQMEQAIDDLLLPYKFDLSAFDRIENPDLKEHIRRAGSLFFTRESASA